MLDADEAGRPRPSLAKACVAAGIVNAKGKAAARESLRGYIQLMDACAPEGGWPLTLGKPELAAAKLARRRAFVLRCLRRTQEAQQCNDCG